MTAAAQLAMFSEAECTIGHKVSVALLADLSPVERAVLRELIDRDAYGKAKMVSTDDMYVAWNRRMQKVHDRRAVRAAIKTLLEVYDLPIGSSRTPGDNGYWFIVSDAEAEDASRHLRNEIFSLFRRLKVISPRSAFVRQLQGQIELLSEESNGTNDGIHGG